MNYQKIHDAIIERAKSRKLEGYKERHHIIPRAMGGTNDKENLVELTAKEHFLIHKLLYKMYPDNDKLFFAYRMMSISKSPDQKREYHITSREFEDIRKQAALAISINNKGNIPWNKGKTGIYSRDTLNSISLTLQGNIPWNKGKTGVYSEETINKMKKSASEKQISAENEKSRREKIRNTLLLKKPRAKTVFDTRDNKQYDTINEFRKTYTLSEYAYTKLRKNGIIIVN